METMIASASNSERAISTPTMMLKNTQSQATYNALNDAKMLKFDKIRQKMLENSTLEKMNDEISEWRDVMYYNEETGEKESKRMLFLAKPFSQQYENEYRGLMIDKRILNQEYFAAKADTQVAFKDYKTKKISYVVSLSFYRLLAKVKDLSCAPCLSSKQHHHS